MSTAQPPAVNWAELVRAMSEGTATPEQQRIALSTMIGLRHALKQVEPTIVGGILNQMQTKEKEKTA